MGLNLISIKRKTGELEISESSNAPGDTEDVGGVLTFANKGAVTCKLEGTPQVVVHLAGYPDVVLYPGNSATLILSVNSACIYGQGGMISDPVTTA